VHEIVDKINQWCQENQIHGQKLLCFFNIIYSHHVEGFEGFVVYVCARVWMALA
jgi:23S rRNA maturation-related 3'-5' exoribonuclease YhaM